MFDRFGFLDYLRKEFPEGQVTSNGNEFICRCRICGDSIKDPHKMRFYIALNNPSGLYLYHCFNCNASGILTANVLRQIANAPNDILLGLAANNNKAEKIIRLNDMTIYNLKYNDIIDNDINRAKLNYFNKRLGLSLSYKDLVDNKIVLSLQGLLEINNINITKPNLVRELDTFYIGGLSSDNTICYMRDISNSSKLGRHFKYVMINTNVPRARYYSIPSKSDMDRRVRINIAEGMFDINSVFFNLRECNRDNEMYTACGSKAYLNCMKSYLRDYGLLNCEFHLYIDRDVSKYITSSISKVFTPLGIKVIGHVNRYGNEKDFGVPKSNIIDETFIISR